MLMTEKDKKVCDLKLQKDIINQIIKEIKIKCYTFNNDEEVEGYIIELYGKIQTFLDILIGWQAYRGDQIHRKNSPT